MTLRFAAAEIAGADGQVTARCDGTVALACGNSGGEDFSERMRGKESS